MSQSTTTTLLTEDNLKLLQSLLESGIIDKTAAESINDMKNKEVQEAVTQKLGQPPHIYTRDNGRIFTKIKVSGQWKQFTASSESELYKRLYDFFYGDQNITLAQVFPRFMLYRRDMGKVTEKTILENAKDWKKFLEDSDIVKVPIRDLKTKDFIRFFEEITKDRTLTRKRVTNIKSLLNKLFAYCIREELTDNNPILNIDFSDFNYYVPDNSNQVYSIENRDKLLAYLHDIKEPFALAIQLDFQLTCRIAEIKALRWENIDFEKRTISIKEQALRQRHLNDDMTFSKHMLEVVPRIKGNTEKGKRVLGMTNEAKRILELAREINPCGEFVFMPFGRLMQTSTFNLYLKKYCESAGVPYLSSHKIRFTSCSLLYRSTGDLAEASIVMGHSQTATTLHYLRNVINNDNVLADMEKAFAPRRTKN